MPQNGQCVAFWTETMLRDIKPFRLGRTSAPAMATGICYPGAPGKKRHKNDHGVAIVLDPALAAAWNPDGAAYIPVSSRLVAVGGSTCQLCARGKVC
jgi:hypothetical protein